MIEKITHSHAGGVCDYCKQISKFMYAEDIQVLPPALASLQNLDKVKRTFLDISINARESAKVQNRSMC